jgi:hypothetical protein
MAVALDRSPQQKDNLCGPFNAARILRELGYAADEDDLALRAGSLLPDDPGRSVPPGAEPNAEYRHELPRVPRASAGTAAGGLAGAIEDASGGELAVVPLRDAWTPERVEGLLGLDARLLANVRTGAFWGSRPPVETLLAELRGEPVEPPPADWDVGHYVELVALVRGPGGALVVVRDSYPSFGWEGTHLQPSRAVAAALERGDGSEGGVLAIVPRGRAAEVERRAGESGLEVSIWDNGTRRA